jgi:hypothetical protein
MKAAAEFTLYSGFIADRAPVLIEALKISDPRGLAPAYALLKRLGLNSLSPVQGTAEEVIEPILRIHPRHPRRSRLGPLQRRIRSIQTFAASSRTHRTISLLTLSDTVKVSAIGVKKLTALLGSQRTCEITRVFSARQAATHLADEMLR